MLRTRVKICGMTRWEDADHAVQSGADALGFVFFPQSPRAIEPSAAQAIVSRLPPFVSVVGLFVNPSTDEVDRALQSIPAMTLQFHGHEPATLCRSFHRPYLKAIAVQTETDWVAIQEQYGDSAGILLDRFHPQLWGGTGETFDWTAVPQIDRIPLILAGGLTPENVAKAIATIHPFAVDVSSGVEESKGIKDLQKITQFMNEVRRVDHG